MRRAFFAPAQLEVLRERLEQVQATTPAPDRRTAVIREPHLAVDAGLSSAATDFIHATLTRKANG